MRLSLSDTCSHRQSRLISLFLAALLAALGGIDAARADVAPPTDYYAPRGSAVVVGAGVAFEQALVQRLAVVGWGAAAARATPDSASAGPELALELRAKLSKAWFWGIYVAAWAMQPLDNRRNAPFVAVVPGTRIAGHIQVHDRLGLEPYVGADWPAYWLFPPECCEAAPTWAQLTVPVFSLGVRALWFALQRQCRSMARWKSKRLARAAGDKPHALLSAFQVLRQSQQPDGAGVGARVCERYALDIKSYSAATASREGRSANPQVRPAQRTRTRRAAPCAGLGHEVPIPVGFSLPKLVAGSPPWRRCART